jgi:sugar phosphate isomerase/epimerase
MPQLKIGIQLASLRMPLQKAITAAARLGASAIEIDARNQLRPAELSRTGARQILKVLDDFGLKVAAVGFLTRRGYGTADEIEGRIAATKDALKMAYQLGAPVVVNQIGRVPAEPQGAEWNLLVETLADLGRFGQRTGAMLAAQTGTESGADLARLIDALPPGSIGVDLDPGNLILNDFSPREATSALGSHIMHVHATDAVRDLARGRGAETPLGRGTADFPELLGALEERNYRGYVTVARHNADDPLAEIGAAVQYLRNL